MSVPVLIVDRDPVQRRLLSAAITRFGFVPSVVAGFGEALALLSAPEGGNTGAAILDLTGLEADTVAVAEVRAVNDSVAIIVQVGQGEVEILAAARRAGAADFVTKPVLPERLKVSIENALKCRALESELARVGRGAALPARWSLPSGWATYDENGDIRPLAQLEAEAIRLAIQHYGGRMTTVARKLGIGRSTLYRKLRELGLWEPERRVAAR